MSRTATVASLGAPAALAGETCPLCEQPIPHEQSAAVKTRIATREREHAAMADESIARVRREAEDKARALVAAAEARSKAELAAVQSSARAAAEAEFQARLANIEARRNEAERQVAALRAEQEAEIQTRLAASRERFEAERVAAVHSEQAKAFDEKQKLLAKIAELQRQVDMKPAQELGEGPESDLFEMLKAEFPEDRISRVEKGAAGADVVHDVFHNGRRCGRIIYDAKNRSAWRNDYVSKLRQDQSAHQADHAVLASKVFPAGQRELTTLDGILIVAPARVKVVAGLLRKHVVQTHALRLSNEARSHKTEALYAFIMSERCRHLMSSISTSADDMTELDRREEKAHQATWKRRAELIRSVQKSHGDLSFEIDRIIGVAGNRGNAADD